MIRMLFAGFFLVLTVVVMPVPDVRASEVAANKAVPLKIAVIDWCPQICPNNENQGYIRDIFDAVFEDGKFSAEFLLFPWSRAIQMTRQGKTIALLSPAKEEAPELVYPAKPIGYQQMCFFARKDQKWQYTGPKSLADQVVGVALNTSVPGLNDYIADNADDFEFQPYSDSYLASSIRMLKAGRTDSFLFTRNTTLYEMRKWQMAEDHHIAGCVEKSPIYVAFSPAAALQTDVTGLAAYFDARFQVLQEAGVIDRIMAKYQIEFE